MIKKIHRCINLLNSMVYGGEDHSSESEQVVIEGRDALEELEKKLSEAEEVNEVINTLECDLRANASSKDSHLQGYCTGLRKAIHQLKKAKVKDETFYYRR